MKYRSDDLTRLLAGAYLRVHRRIDAAMAEQGASLSRTKLLLLIEAKAGTARAADIATWLGQAPRTVTEALDGLERDALIERTADPLDRRVKRLAITDAGRAAVAATEPLRHRLTSEIFRTLTDDEREQFGATLEKLTETLDADLLCNEP